MTLAEVGFESVYLEMLWPSSRSMEDSEHLYLFPADAIGNDIGCAGNHQLSGSQNSAGATQCWVLF